MYYRELIEVTVTVIIWRNLDTVRNVDRFCQFGHTYASNCIEKVKTL